MISYARQDITQEDIQAVVAALQSDFLTQGPMVPRFEEAVASQCKAKHGIAVNSATSALHIACLALKLGPGDILWTVPNTFVASANCGRYCGADVDFVDIDSFTWNISIPALHKKLNEAKSKGNLPKVVVPVHFSGQPTDQEAIWELSREFGFRVLEDASHSLGAARNAEPVGSCRWSHITIFSFHAVKIITSGEGGMALTNNDELAFQMQLLRSHGITRDQDRMKQESQGPWYYEQLDLGYNYRMTDMQAALGERQLARLENYIVRRNYLATRYNKLLSGLPLQLPKVHSENRSSFHLYVIRLKKNEIKKTHRQVFECLRNLGIGVNLHYMPVHLQPYYRSLGFGPGLCPEAEQYGTEAMTLPLYPGLSDGDQELVVAALKQALLQ